MRSKKKQRRRYRKYTQLSSVMHGMDAYKERLNEDNKFDSSSIRNINKQLNAHIQNKRNAQKMDISGHLSDVTKRKKVAAVNYQPRSNEAEIKLKKYIDIVTNSETDFQDFIHTELIHMIVNEVMLKQDYRKLLSQCQSFQ